MTLRNAPVSVSYPLSQQWSMCHHTWLLNVGSRDLNSGLQASIRSLNEPSTQSTHWVLVNNPVLRSIWYSLNGIRGIPELWKWLFFVPGGDDCVLCPLLSVTIHTTVCTHTNFPCYIASLVLIWMNPVFLAEKDERTIVIFTAIAKWC